MEKVTLRYQDKEVPVVEDWRVDEQIEAENALNLDLEATRSGGKLAVIFYISIRRVDKELPQHVLADAVMRMNISSVSKEEEGALAVPLEEANGSGHSSETDEQQTSGLPLSANSG